MKNLKKITFQDYADQYGHLTPIEENKDIPFTIKRVYYISKVEADVRRGFHAHRKLEQVLICVSGKVKILLKTPEEELCVELTNQTEGIYVGPMIWREMYDFSKDAVLLVLSSELYDVDDYIRNYQIYEKEAEKYFIK